MKNEERFDSARSEIFGLIIHYLTYRIELIDFHNSIDNFSVSETISKTKMLEYAKRAIFYEAFEYSKGMKGEQRNAVKNRMNCFVESCEKILNKNG